MQENFTVRKEEEKLSTFGLLFLLSQPEFLYDQFHDLQLPSISSTLNASVFLYKRHFGSFFPSYMYVTCTWKKAAKMTFVQKTHAIKLMKLAPGFNFINILCTAFAPADIPKV
jgi:hypothetical protein